jgi:uncharacterized membrane protein YfcA
VRSLPTILLVLALPAGAVGYLIGVRVLQALLPEAIQGLVPFAAVFIAGLAMLPFLIPYFDRKAKQDLAAYRRSAPNADAGGTDPKSDGTTGMAGDA